MEPTPRTARLDRPLPSPPCRSEVAEEGEVMKIEKWVPLFLTLCGSVCVFLQEHVAFSVFLSAAFIVDALEDLGDKIK